MTKLSIIVPAYNLGAYIGECLLSLLEQQVNFEYELIVCDDASTDETSAEVSKVAEKHPQVKPIFKSNNAGLAANMRSLLKVASAEYIAYLDGDDVALPGKLQRQVDYLDQHPSCSMVYHESDMFDSETGATIKAYSSESYNWSLIPSRSTIEHLIRYGTYMQASSVMFRHHPRLLDTVPDRSRIILDYPFYIGNAGYLGGSIDYLPETLGRYRVHSNSFGAQNQRSLERRQQCCEDMVNACRMAAKFAVPLNVIEAGVAHQYFACALYFLKRNEDDLFKQAIQQSAVSDQFFDERHIYAWQHWQQPEVVRAQLQSVWGLM